MIAALAVLAVLSSSLAAQEGAQLSRARIQLTGPLERVSLILMSSETTLDARVATGEHFEVLVPVVAESSDPEMHWDVDGHGETDGARFIAWDREFADASRTWWDGLSASLRARPRPSLPGADAQSLGRAPATALFLLLAFVPLAISLRRRAMACLVSAIACSAALVAITLVERPAASYARVLEGDGTTQRWVAVDCALDSLRIQSVAPMRLTYEGARWRGVSLSTTLAAAEHGPWIVSAERTRLWLRTPCDPLERKFTPQSNAWGMLEECWVRAADGGWSARGAWEIGRPLPAALEGPGDPPGWLNPALPMGSAILIGRLAPGSFAGEGAGAGPVWVRLVGF